MGSSCSWLNGEIAREKTGLDQLSFSESEAEEEIKIKSRRKDVGSDLKTKNTKAITKTKTKLVNNITRGDFVLK